MCAFAPPSCTGLVHRSVYGQHLAFNQRAFGSSPSGKQGRVINALSTASTKTLAGLKWSYRLGTDRDFARKKWAELVLITKHTWEGIKTGSKLFKKNASISHQLLRKRVKGHPLKLQEHKLLLRTVSDAFKLVPFSFFVIVPFAELLLPVALWIWPNMLPSTFKELISDDSRKLRRLRAKKEMAAFFEEVIKKNAEHTEFSGDKRAEWLELQRVMQSHTAGSAFPKQFLKFAKLFHEEFQLENMPLEHLQAICRLLGISPYGFQSHVVLQLRHYVTGLLAEDRHIRWEGVDALSHEDLRDACKARGMLPEDGASDSELRLMLEHWLDLSSQKDMPISLLLWSRSYVVSEDKKLLEPKVEGELECLPSVEESATVEKYRHRVEVLLQRLKELEDMEAEVSSLSDVVGSDGEDDEEPHDRSELLRKVQALESQVHNKKKIIEMQHEILRQQIELMARLRELPSLQNLPRRHSKEMRSELKKMYDQFEAELKQLEETIRVTEGEDTSHRFYPEKP